MSRARNILRNTAWLTAAQALTSVAALFVTGYVAEKLGPADYGEMELAIAFVNFFSPIIFAGIQIPVIKAIVNDRKHRGRAFGDALVIRLAMTPIFVGLVWAAAPWAIPEVRGVLIWLAIVNTFFTFYVQSVTVPIEADERMHFMGLATLLQYVVAMTLSVGAVWLALGSEGVLGARLIGSGVEFLFLGVVVAVFFYRPKLRPEVKRYKDYARRGVPLVFSYLLGLVLLEVDKVMLPHLIPGEAEALAAVGQYQSATVLAYKFEMIIIPFVTAITPPLVNALEERPAEFQALLGRALRFALILGLPIAVGTGMIAPDVIGFVFGDAYLVAVPVLAVLVWFVPLQFVNRVMAAAVAVDDKERWVAVAVAIAVIVNVAANILLIPSLGITGAAAATIASEALLALIYFLVMRRHARGLFGELELVRVLIAVAVMGTVAYLIRSVNAVVIIAVAAVVYGAAVLGLRAVTKDEINALRGR